VFRGHVRAARANRGKRAARVAVTISVIAAAAAAVSVGLLLSSGGGPSGGSPSGGGVFGGIASPGQAQKARQAARLRQDTAPASTAPASNAPPSTVPASTPPASTAPASTVIATVLSTAPRYASPGRLAPGTGSANTVPASWYDRPSVLPVIATSPGWVQVRLAQRPNGSTAWLPDDDVTLGSTPYRIVINAATAWLALYDHGRLVFSAPAGVGTTEDPTPAGEYFVAFDEQPPQPNAGYGPFIIVTSAHSPAIADWEGSGDAVIGIHGPLGDDTEIGTSGARISHGCIRLHDQALERLAEVPPGTPIDVVS
jgi:lipoprotein-anchoring transpeptidase ErfK/SrfK